MTFILKSNADTHLAFLCSFAVSILFLGVGLSAYSDNYGIVLDNTCKTMLKNNISSNCPTYEDIITLFPDTSNRKISGEFGYHNGVYQRLSTNITNSFEYYRFTNSSILFIDPPVDTRSRIHLIEIKANLAEYKLPGDGSYNKIDHSLTLGVGRYIDNCRLAYVDAIPWIFLVGDTINHMSHGCSADSTTFISRITTQLNHTTHDIRDSYKYKLEQFQKEAIDKCGKKICLYEKDQPTPP